LSAPNIILVGFMGTGKSVVGQRLAERLGHSFVDTDTMIAASAGRSIPQIFAKEGEAGFRNRETEALRELTAARGVVVATGGGILGREENVLLLRRIGRLVCLTARPELIMERTRPWVDRPMLAGAQDPRAVIEQLLTARAAGYLLAEVTVDTSDRSVEEVVDELCRVLT
jgi:shikimate kinase